MTVKRMAGDKGLADVLFSRIIRSRGVCQYPGCGSTNVVTAHIIGRSASGTRCHEDNAWALCPSHHQLVDAWWDEKQRMVEHTIGRARYDALQVIAREHKFRAITSKTFWSEEVARLRARCDELGIDKRRTVPA